MKENNYKVSIVVPVYKVEKYIHRCLESILCQTYENWEVILVDDGSPDHCPQICDEYARKEGRITVIHQENKGLGSARNVGMKCATGDILTFVDSDDWLCENALELIVDKWNESSEILIFDYFDTDGTTSCHRQCMEKEKVNFEKDEKYTKEWLEQAVCYMRIKKNARCLGRAGAIVFNLYVVKQNQLYFTERAQIAEDRVYLMKVLSRVQHICYYAIPIYFYFNNPGSITHTSYNGKKTVNILKRLSDDISTFFMRDVNDRKRKVYTLYMLLLPATWRAAFCKDNDKKLIEQYIVELRQIIIKEKKKLPSCVANMIVFCSKGVFLQIIELVIQIKEKLA